MQNSGIVGFCVKSGYTSLKVSRFGVGALVLTRPWPHFNNTLNEAPASSLIDGIESMNMLFTLMHQHSFAASMS